ncbi:MAG: transposase, partial [Armatimonadota bacterium]|nr:transposase [Armatimonadota bacterium]MDR7508795.1 transposase [Armatimonadota bacterium]
MDGLHHRPAGGCGLRSGHRRPLPSGVDFGGTPAPALIRDVIRETPFAGEGYRKVTARLKRAREVHVGRKRVLRLMR